MTDRDLPRDQVDQAAWNEEGRDPAGSLVAQRVAGFDDALEAADAGADHHAGGDLVFTALGVPAGILERHVGRSNTIENELVDLALFLGLHPVIRIEGSFHRRIGGDRTGDLGRDVADVEIGDP